jgi:hypothetical protein
MDTEVRDGTTADRLIVLGEAEELDGQDAEGLLHRLAAGGDVEAREAVAFLSVLRSQPWIP